VEECIPDIKRAIQTEVATPLRALPNLSVLPSETWTRQREQILLQAVRTALHVVTWQLVQTHQNYVLAQFPQMLQ
jgi:hypothetical protein